MQKYMVIFLLQVDGKYSTVISKQMNLAKQFNAVIVTLIFSGILLFIILTGGK